MRSPMRTATETGTDKRARLCASPFATAAREFEREIFRTVLIRSSPQKITGPGPDYRAFTELSSNTAVRSEVKANCKNARRVCFCLPYGGSESMRQPHD